MKKWVAVLLLIFFLSLAIFSVLLEREVKNFVSVYTHVSAKVR
ncbi:MAG TPA: hypothetical protein VF810_04060 [Patescibacteria group bacterium]